MASKASTKQLRALWQRFLVLVAAIAVGVMQLNTPA